MWYSYFMIKMQRVVVYVPQDTHRELKSKLAKEGISVSEWFRLESESFLSLPKKILEKKSESVAYSPHASIPVTIAEEEDVGPTTFKLCKDKWCNKFAEEGSDFCKEHK